MTTSLSDAIAQTERALLGSILLSNPLWPQTAAVSTNDFSLDSHRRIFGCMAAMFEDPRPVDIVTLAAELSERKQLDSIGDAAYLSELLDHALPEAFEAYVRNVRKASPERRYARQLERLLETNTNEERLDVLRQMQDGLTGTCQPQNWRSLFHTYDEIINAPSARFAIRLLNVFV
jgi:replicative DNA helicase